MGAILEMRCKKSAQNATTVTLVADDQGGEGRPTHLAPTQIVATFTATPAEMFGSATTDGRKFLVRITEYT